MSYQMTAYSKPKLPSHTNCNQAIYVLIRIQLSTIISIIATSYNTIVNDIAQNV